MTYLQIVNKVLRLLREDEISSVLTADDVVAVIVCDFVNDAKRLVEEAHTWNALRTEWSVSTAIGSDYVSLTGSGKYAIIESIYRDGIALTEQTNQRLDYLKANSSTQSSPVYYAVNGLDASSDIRLRLHPTPDAIETLTVSGFKRQDDLALDGDVLLIPHQPVLYYALAFAARERGEVGGQTAAELFAMAKEFMSNAVANDVALSNYEYDWYAN